MNRWALEAVRMASAAAGSEAAGSGLDCAEAGPAAVSEGGGTGSVDVTAFSVGFWRSAASSSED